ncbi:hypothetical protein [Nocardia brasiliensis]|uniref:hypothetical protein n=1 Tax=Nocardia brasiliensis TaxID=37326 RepID=UPI0024571C0B|nr:hypothetical protein [Nocardia brasiliensis]
MHRRDPSAHRSRSSELQRHRFASQPEGVSSAFMSDKGVIELDRPWAECVAEAKRALLAGAEA